MTFQILTLLLLLLATLPTALSLTCWTYGGNALGWHSGEGTQSCPTMNNQMCVQTVYWVLDLLSYGMSCDDNNFCGSLPDKACCTRHQPLTFGKNMIVKCNGGDNFEEATMDFNSFPDVCSTPCEQCTEEGDCHWPTSPNTIHKGVDGLPDGKSIGGGTEAQRYLHPLAVVGVVLGFGAVIV